MIKQALYVFLFFLFSTCFLSASFPVDKKDNKNSSKHHSNMVNAKTIKVSSIDFDLPVQVSSEITMPQKVSRLKVWKEKLFRRSTGGKAWGIASLACGLLAIAFPPLAILAVVFGAIGFNKPLNGLAIAGFCLGLLTIVITAIILSFFFSFLV
jgi:hypothetical protein